MKANILRNVFCIAILGICALGTISCRSTKTTVAEHTVVLDDNPVPLTNWVKCSSCAGKGECNRCKGTGKVSGSKCVTCAGTGKCVVCNGEGGYRSR